MVRTQCFHCWGSGKLGSGAKKKKKKELRYSHPGETVQNKDMAKEGGRDRPGSAQT